MDTRITNHKILLTLISMLGFWMMPAKAIGEDIAAPQIVELQINPSFIDVTSGGQNMTLTLRITDDLSGFKHLYCYLYSPSQNQRIELYVDERDRITGDAINGIYQKTIPFSESSETGTWFLGLIEFSDNLNTTRYLYQTDLIDLGFPTEIEVIGISDSSPPTLVGLSFNPTSLDVTTGPQDVTINLRLTDDVSGFKQLYCYIYSPSQNQRIEFYMDSSNRISGDAIDGVYQVDVTFGYGSESGMWFFGLIEFTDNLNTTRYLYQDDLIDLGFSTEIEVISISDSSPPTLVELSFNPTSLDVTTGPQDVTISLRLTDDVSGFKQLYCYIYSPSQNQRIEFYMDSSNRISGDAVDGVYQVDVTFGYGSESGMWFFGLIEFTDNLNTTRYLYQDDLIELGFPTEIEVNSYHSSEEAVIETIHKAQDVVIGLPQAALLNKNSANALINKLNVVLMLTEIEFYELASDKLLNDVLRKMDGCANQGEPDRNDWILTCEAQTEVYPLLIQALELLYGLVG
ncbi:hypothetical protein ACFL6U_11340 [Planctomycetota bacterium]